MHTLLNLRGNIPAFVHITDGKVHDVNVLDQIVPEAGAFYVMDRGYIDFERLFVLTLSSAFFVVRTKSNVLLQRRYSHPVEKSTGVCSDQAVILSSFESASAYPDALRKVSYCDAESGKRIKLLTNNFTLPALTIAQIYKQRWQVELFFKWIKQHLRIKAFYGTSENAVKTQIWIAVSVYVLVAIMRKRLGLEATLYQILQILSLTLFEKTPILCALQTIMSASNPRFVRRFSRREWRCSGVPRPDNMNRQQEETASVYDKVLKNNARPRSEMDAGGHVELPSERGCRIGSAHRRPPGSAGAAIQSTGRICPSQLFRPVGCRQ